MNEREALNWLRRGSPLPVPCTEYRKQIRPMLVAAKNHRSSSIAEIATAELSRLDRLCGGARGAA